MIGSLTMLCTIYASFSWLCYYAWGATLTEPVVTEMLPAGNIWVQVMKMLFCLNLAFSYPLTSAIIFEGLQEFILGEGAANDRSKKWKVNAIRTGVVVGSVTFSIVVANSLDKVISLLGAILGVTIVLAIPSYCHFKLIAKTKAQKAKDVIIGFVAISMLVVGPVSIVLSW